MMKRRWRLQESGMVLLSQFDDVGLQACGEELATAGDGSDDPSPSSE